jgi:isopropylmalate/homocitrate/citramalate synthase
VVGSGSGMMNDVDVTITDVGPRDGLQNEPETLPASTRAELVNRLASAGLPRVEAVSFVDPRRVPQMAEAEEVVAAVDRRDGVVYAGLALNERGYERLRATGLDEVHYSFGATESFQQRNVGSSVDDAVAAARRIVDRAHTDSIHATVTISVAFGCPFEGRVDPARVADLAEQVVDADELLLADTIGVATPTRVRRLVDRISILGRPVGVHLHNTRNTGYANAYAALEAGVRLFDASIGGLGGCPYAPNATGNIATEDLVYLLEGEGLDPGVDLAALIAVSEWLEGLLGRRLEGYVYRAGGSPAPTTPAAPSSAISAAE